MVNLWIRKINYIHLFLTSLLPSGKDLMLFIRFNEVKKRKLTKLLGGYR
jgi:hypothetical protein